ncbi:Ig-like domain-containing protein [Paenibacillus sp. S-38]|uniref:S-layer homology domain-containing protein n=1 Tax=Paenibacillus sp. S-38 TaxID=3416710 RepID=UPI003CFBAC21
MYRHQAIKVLTTAALLGTLVSPVQASPLKRAFTDIEHSYAKGTIEQLVEAGIVEGVGEGQFNPAGRMSRQDFVIILTRALGLDISNPPSAPTFTDIPEQHYAYPYIEAAVKAGLVSGMGEGRFGGAQPLTRQDMAVIFAASLEDAAPAGAAASVTFQDAEAIAEYAKAAVAKAAELGLIEGGDDGRFRPLDEADRQAVAMVAGRFLQRAPHTIQRISSDAVYIGGRKYTASEQVQGILHPRNSQILQGAKIRFEEADGQINKITYLELRSSGKAALPGGEEFSGNLLLNGQQGVIDGTLKVAADFISMKDLTITGDLEVSRALQQDFYSESIDVKGKTLVNGGDTNTVVFKDSTLTTVDVNKEDVRVEVLGQAFVQEVNVASNATLVGSGEASIDQVTVKVGAQSVQLQGTVGSLQVNTASTITGNANIGKVTVDTTAPVTLGTTGTVNQLDLAPAASKVTLGAQTQVQSLTLPAGVAPSSAVTNYTQVQSQIGAVNGVQSTSAPASTTTTSSSGGGSSTGSSPKVASPISDFTITMGSTKDIDLFQVFSDADNNITSYKAQLVKTASAPEIVTAAVNGNILTVEPRLKGKITVRVQAFDKYNNKATDDFIVTVNQHPVAADVPEQYVTLNAGDTRVNLNTYFNDPDLDALTYEAAASDHPEVAAGTVSGSELILTPVGPGSASITVAAIDGKGGSVSKMISVTTNRAPAADAVIAEQVVTLGTAGKVGLSNAFEDLDGDTLTFEAAVQDLQVAAVTVNGSELQITPAGDGQTTVTVTAKDGKGGQASQAFTVRTNRAPQVASPSADQDVMIGAGPLTVDLTSVFSDTNGDSLTLQAVSADPGIVAVSLAGKQVQITPVAGGSTTVTLTADDGHGGSMTDDFLVRVNEAPALGQPIADLTLQENGSAEIVDLSGSFTDANGDALTLTAASADTGIATVSVSGTKLTAVPVSFGSTKVTVTADDGRGGTVSGSFTVKVNRKPEAAGSLTGQTITIGEGSQTVDFSGLFTDPDGDSWTIEAVSADPGLAGVSVTDKQVHLTPVAAGSTSVTVTAKDGRGGSLSRTFAVDINRAPQVLNALEDKAMTWGDSDLQLDVSTLFCDEDQDSLTLTAESLSPNVAAAALSQGQLTIHPVTGGTAEIRVTANDGRGGQQSDTFTVRINRAPQASPIQDQTVTLFSGDTTIDLSGIFTDPDGDALTITAVSSDAAAAAVSMNGSRLTLSPVAVGTASVSVTAVDGHGGTVTRSFEVTVRPNQAPTVAAPISSQRMNPNRDVTVNLTPVFSDADGDTLTYEAVSSDSAIASVSVNGSQLIVTGMADGQAVITVTAHDPAGNSVQTTFSANVSSNESPVVAGTVPLQLIGTGVPANQFSIAHLFSDPDNDTLTYTATAADGNLVQASMNGSTLTISPGAGHGRTTVTVTADDGRGGVTNATIDVMAVQVVNNQQILTKQGVSDVSYDLSAFFPTQNSLTIYNQPKGAMTPDVPQPLNGKVFKVAVSGLGTTGYWVIAADGTGAFIEVVVQEQQGAGVYFAEYARGPEGRIELEFYNHSESEQNYTVVGYRYNRNTQQMEVMKNRDINPLPYAAVNQIYPGTLGIVINYTFYDLMDITPVQWYHNELEMTGNGYVVCAFELVKNGQVVDVIGDKNWRPSSNNTEPLPTIGNMIRKKGIRTGSTAFQMSGEWDLTPLNYSTLFSHTP